MMDDPDSNGEAALMRRLLAGARTIAVVGASPAPWRPSSGIARYLARAGYRVIPVNPTALGRDLDGMPFRADLRDLDEPVDIVNVFRRPEHVPAVVEDAVAAGAPALWLQLGIRHPEAARRAEERGIAVVADRCISVEHRRLFG
ncbi:MAG: CoA-binding protein [Methylobacterium frigidaeris]